jgi:AraC family transcriptional regulator
MKKNYDSFLFIMFDIFIYIFQEMNTNVILIRNMVCNRCIMSVTNILERGKISFQSVILGEIHLSQEINQSQKEYLSTELGKIGFEMIDSRMGGLIEKIKSCTIKKARNEVGEKEQEMKLSEYLSAKLNYEYTHLSSIFSEVEGRTIENFFIEQRIEKAKELLVYGHMTLSEIAFDLDYSSTAHLSTQFKKVTGLTPSHFKSIGAAKRKSLDKV